MSDLTKKAIKATFIDLLNSRPLGQITVKMIVSASCTGDFPKK